MLQHRILSEEFVLTSLQGTASVCQCLDVVTFNALLIAGGLQMATKFHIQGQDAVGSVDFVLSMGNFAISVVEVSELCNRCCRVECAFCCLDTMALYQVYATPVT